MFRSSTAFRFARQLSRAARSDGERAAILTDPGFGVHFTDHTVVIDHRVDARGRGGWRDARVEPYGPIPLDPAANVLHYGQEVFEGLKAYRHADGSVVTFRPELNARRLNRSAARLALPELPEELFLESLRQLVAVDRDWIPTREGESLYLRPFMIATEPCLGVRAAREVSFRVIASPAGNYFGGELRPISIWLSTGTSRAGVGGTGEAKCGGNYAASLSAQAEAEANGCQQVLFLEAGGEALEELGCMNLFLVHRSGVLSTPALTGTILDGVTRRSIIQLARDRGLRVEERTITLSEWRQGAARGDVTEVFACGTAAIITPIGELRTPAGPIRCAGGPVVGSLTRSLRAELLGIQTGAVPDRHGWLTRLAEPLDDTRSDLDLCAWAGARAAEGLP
jgi:branched-chain amino acid aminotransferase